MSRRELDRTAHRAVTAVAAITLLSGVVQMVAPGLVLRTVSGPQSTADRHLFRIVGMFMAVVGALVVDAQREPRPDSRVLLWAGAQKIGASAGVGLGVARGVFGARALGVAAFDLSSAVLFLWYRGRRRR